MLLSKRLADLLWLPVNELLTGELRRGELGWLLAPQRHFALLSARRAGTLVNRVRLFAFLLAVLTPLWSVVDLLTFPFPLWAKLLLMRLMAAAAFGNLVLHHRAEGRIGNAYAALAQLVGTAVLFYVCSHTLLSYYPLQGVAATLAEGYTFLPFILMAGLSLFPLSLLEGACFVLPVLVGQFAAAWASQNALDWSILIGAFWLLLLISMVAMLASVSQLAFMVALVRNTIRDKLTGAFSRTSAQEVLEMHFTGALRNDTPLALAFLDVDHFKLVNDRFGHDAGDRTLQAMARSLGHSLRHGDMLARWGGEEFLLIMPNTDKAQALAALQRMRASGIGARPDGTPLTASIGLAERSADQVGDWESLVQLADQRMYSAKQGGRDAIVSTSAEPASV